jgi:hypothetical protein
VYHRDRVFPRGEENTCGTVVNCTAQTAGTVDRGEREMLLEALVVIGAGLIGGAIGYDIGRNKVIDRMAPRWGEWNDSTFDGDPPPQYENWTAFINSDKKAGVYVRAKTADGK